MANYNNKSQNLSGLTYAIFFSAADMAALQGSFFLNGNSAVKSTSILQFHHFYPWFLGS